MLSVRDRYAAHCLFLLLYNMIYPITKLNDSYIKFIQDDPVRPLIPIEKRIAENFIILVLLENEAPDAITCVSFQDQIPKHEEDLFEVQIKPTIAVF